MNARFGIQIYDHCKKITLQVLGYSYLYKRTNGNVLCSNRFGTDFIVSQMIFHDQKHIVK